MATGLFRSSEPVVRPRAAALLAAVAFTAFACPSLAWCADEKGAPEIPLLQVEASVQSTREDDTNFRYRIQYRGMTVSERSENEESSEPSAEGSRGNPTVPHSGNPEARGGSTAVATSSGQTSSPGQPTYPAVRLDYDWSGETGGPDLLRLHLGNDVWTRPLGLDRHLRDWAGTIEGNATHNLGTLNLSVGIQRPFSDLLRFSPRVAHYLLVGLDLERASPADDTATIHGNVTLEGFWSRGWGWRPESVVDVRQAERDATAAVTRAGTTPIDELTTELTRARSVVLATVQALPAQDLDLPEEDAGAPVSLTLTSPILRKGKWDDDSYAAVWRAVAPHIAPTVRLEDSKALKESLSAQARTRAQARCDCLLAMGWTEEQIQELQAGLLRPTYWDLLAVTVPGVGDIYTRVLQCSCSDQCPDIPKTHADQFRTALGDVVLQFDATRDNEHLSMRPTSQGQFIREEDGKVLLSGQDLVSLLVESTVLHEGRSVPALVFSLQAIAWAPIGGAEDYTIRGTLEPRLLWQLERTSKFGLAATYKYGYERSTRTEKVDEWFVGLNYTMM